MTFEKGNKFERYGEEISHNCRSVVFAGEFVLNICVNAIEINTDAACAFIQCAIITQYYIIVESSEVISFQKRNFRRPSEIVE